MMVITRHQDVDMHSCMAVVAKKDTCMACELGCNLKCATS